MVSSCFAMFGFIFYFPIHHHTTEIINMMCDNPALRVWNDDIKYACINIMDTEEKRTQFSKIFQGHMNTMDFSMKGVVFERKRQVQLLSLHCDILLFTVLCGIVCGTY
jgi:hypothetical protein